MKFYDKEREAIIKELDMEGGEEVVEFLYLTKEMAEPDSSPNDDGITYSFGKKVK